jgi:hypothetical protein
MNLEVVTHTENIGRSWAKRRALALAAKPSDIRIGRVLEEAAASLEQPRAILHRLELRR